MLCGLTDLVSQACFYTLINSSWKISLRRCFLEHGKKVFEKLSRFNFFLYAATSIFQSEIYLCLQGILLPIDIFPTRSPQRLQITEYKLLWFLKGK